MIDTENKYWPFYVLPESQRTELHQHQIDFVEAAYDAGFRPYITKQQDFGASSDTRSGEIYWRGGRDRRWHLFLIEDDNGILTAYVDGFDFTAQALMQWLQGDDLEAVLTTVHEHLYSEEYPPIIHQPVAIIPSMEPLPHSPLPR